MKDIRVNFGTNRLSRDNDLAVAGYLVNFGDRHQSFEFGLVTTAFEGFGNGKRECIFDFCERDLDFDY